MVQKSEEEAHVVRVASVFYPYGKEGTLSLIGRGPASQSAPDGLTWKATEKGQKGS